MTLTEHIDSTIALLQASREDAEKFDGGKVGAPGTRVRKTAGEVGKALREIKAHVLAQRKAAKEAV